MSKSMKQNKPKTTKSQSTSPKVFDVSKPGGSAPNSSARPLIVTHRPMVQDPMMTTPPAVDDPMAPTPGAPEVPKTVLKPQKIKLQPSPEAIQELAEQAAAEKDITTDEKSPEPTAVPAESAPEPSSDVAVPITVKSTSSSSSLVAETPADESESDSDSATPAAKPVVDAPPKLSAEQTAQKDAAADAERQEEYEQIIDTRKYYVHIASPTKKRSMHLAVIGAILIILVAVGCADAMLDAGILDVSGLPHTNFIK
jgi:hypothetical protein